ncbi:MAG TPA: lytic transglycosylase domain-containing protein [Fimbriimonadaceae bacterium]|nr:lytic transglycosylase domain-containing protein [Fimbriimonadaceae bacterium]
MRRLIFVLALSCAALAHGQSVSDYLAARKQQHIVQPTSAQALRQVEGPAIVEVQGVVQGSFKSGSVTSLMIQLDNGDTQLVDCNGDLPEWLGNGEVRARLLLRVNRDDSYAQMTATLLMAAPEDDLAKVDEAYWRKEAAVAKKRQEKQQKSRNGRGAALASRGGSAMYGWIGRARPRNEYRLNTNFDPKVVDQYTRYVLSRNPRLGYAKAQEITYAILSFSYEYGVDARLVVAILIVESDFDPNSTSRAGAMGLGQLMPATAAWMGVRDPYDATDNLHGMVKLLRTHLTQYRAMTGENFESLRLALAAYNAGEGAVRRHGGVPPYRETQAYVQRVIQIYESLIPANERTG